MVVGTVVLVSGLDRRSEERQTRRNELVRAVAADPIELITMAARAHRVLILGDVLGAEPPKRFAADVIEALAFGPGLDVVALEVDSDLQPAIDSYLEAPQEDASLLLSEPRVVREWEGTARAYLEIYHRVRTVNDALGASRRVRIIALDSPGWPPSPPPSPARLAKWFGERGEHMAETLHHRVLGRSDRTRILVLVDGMQALHGRAHMETGGEVLDSIPLLAGWLDSEAGTRAFSVLVVAPPDPAPGLGLAGFRSGELHASLEEISPSAFGFRVTPGIAIDTTDMGWWHLPGVSLRILPDDERSLVDAVVRLPG